MSIKINSQNFENEVLNSQKPVLVDFWAEWCGPCREVGPVLDEISNEHSARFTVAKVNVDENPEIASQYGIRSIPTMILFKDGIQTDSLTRALPKQHIVSFVNKSLQQQ